MTRFLLTSFVIFFLAGCATVEVSQEPRPLLHPLFSDHAVLQRDSPVPIWGWAEPGTEVTVQFAGQSKSAKTGRNGKWTCSLDPLTVSDQGQTLTVETDRPGLRAEAKDLLVGDVWLCSGQSNMEWSITRINEDEEIAGADFPNIRLLTVKKATAYEPKEVFEGDWMRCSPEALRESEFSAVAYFFGKKIHQDLNIPIGLIHSSWGGTFAEAWTSTPALKDFPEFKAQLEELAGIANSSANDPDIEYLNAWFQRHDPGTQKQWDHPETDASDWRKVTLPGRWADCGIPGYEGVVWAQRKIELPSAWADQALVLHVGEISDSDTTWLNGTVVGRTDFWGVPRRYEIPAGIAQAGVNTVTLRVTNAGGGGIVANKNPLSIYPQGKASEAISLAGEWRLQETAPKAKTGRPIVGNPRVTSVLYNGMIAPLVPASMTGVIWYQGEANASRAKQYQRLLPTMIYDWRDRFENDALAFHIVSLANYQKAHSQPRDNNWAELREAQAMTAQNVPHSGLAIAIDIGEANDIHPKNKRDVGKRLALAALANTYEQPVAGSGPWYRSAKVENGSIRIKFDHTDGGLEFRGPTGRSFAIAGKDRKFVWAEARIDGDSVLVSSPEVPEPVAVRYAWDSNPQACLYNGADLPAVPFRTDSWPGISQ